MGDIRQVVYREETMKVRIYCRKCRRRHSLHAKQHCDSLPPGKWGKGTCDRRPCPLVRR